MLESDLKKWDFLLSFDEREIKEIMKTIQY